MIKKAEQYSIGLWLVVALMLATATLRLSQNVDRPVIQASSYSYFTVGACVDGRVFGWGDKGIGTEASGEVGCFDADGNKIEQTFSLEACRARACQ